MLSAHMLSQEAAPNHAFQFLDVLEHADMGILVTDATTRVVWLNETLARYFEVIPSTLIGRTRAAVFREVLAPRLAHPDVFLGRTLYSPSSHTRTVLHVPHPQRRLEHWAWSIESGAFLGGRIDHFIDVTGQQDVLEPLQRPARSQFLDFSSRSLAANGK